MDTAKKLLSKIDMVDGHWLWNGSTSIYGYGVIVICGKKYPAHVVAYETFIGPVPEGLCVLHKEVCVKRHNCINPDHLYAGSRSDNSKDCFKFGGRGRSRLTDDNIIEIRLSTERYDKLAEKFCISKQAVSQIKHGHTWKTVTPEIKGVLSPMARIVTYTPRFNKGRSKLSAQDVIDIRNSSNRPRNELALKYGLTPQSITHIWKGHTFKDA
jgi:hypothetical protein